MATAYIKVDGEKVGTVRLWVYGSEALMRQPDQEFRDNSYQAMFIAGGVAIVLACDRRWISEFTVTRRSSSAS